MVSKLPGAAPCSWQLTSIVAADTLMKWIRAEKKGGQHQPPVRGRRRTREQIGRLITKLTRENQWGYTRIMKKNEFRAPNTNAFVERSNRNV